MAHCVIMHCAGSLQAHLEEGLRCTCHLPVMMLGVSFDQGLIESCALLQALPLALAAAKDNRGNAFKDAIELLLDVLGHVDNSGNIYDPDNALAAMLEALGNMHTDDPEVRAPCLNRYGMCALSRFPMSTGGCWRG